MPMVAATTPQIITVTDLPTALQSADMVDVMVAGANARAARVAPCLVRPSAAWAATTAYAVGAQVYLTGGEALEATVAGTSATFSPSAPDAIDATVIDGTVTWKRIAPTAAQLAEAKLVLLGAVKRWVEAGSGALSSQTAGPFGLQVDTRQRTGFNLWPSEITDLQAICKAPGEGSRQAFSLDTAPTSLVHQPWCDLNLGGTTCSCGADIAGYPLYEL